MASGEEEAPPSPDTVLLTEIRDLLAGRPGSPNVRGSGGRARCYAVGGASQPGVDADCGAGVPGAHLDQVAELVRPSTALGRARHPSWGVRPPDHRVRDAALVAHLADQRVVLVPDAQDAVAGAVLETVDGSPRAPPARAPHRAPAPARR